MSAIDALRQKVRAEKIAQAQAEECARQERIAEMRERWESGVGADLMSELQVEVDRDGYGTLHYRDRQIKFRAWAGRPDNQSLAAVIVEWIENVDAGYREREAARDSLLYELPLCDNGFQLHDHQGRIAKYDLEGDTGIIVALGAAEDRIKETEAAQEQRAKAKRDAEACELVARLDQLDDFLLPEIPWHLDDVSEVVEACERACARIEAKEQEREAQRAVLAANVFEPFVYYRICYALMAEDDGERYADWQTLDSLSDTCGGGGWWYSARGNDSPVRLSNVFKVERIEVREPDKMPNWCPTEETEFGKIQLVPGGAERL